MNVEFTSPALRDLEELRAYYKPRSKTGLANMLAEIQDTILAELRQFQQEVESTDDITLVIIKVKADI